MRPVVYLLVALLLPATAAADVSFRFPGSDAHREHFYITAYRDLSGSGGGLQDWGCGTKTYDGHRGTDMGVGGFPGMDAGRDVVAAAAGVVTYVNDGVFDRCTSGSCSGGGGFGNYVRIEHDDGKVTYYGHLKKFSIVVGVGDRVTCGQKLGQVGSSGYSTGPHLHFEPRVGGVSDDPFSGPCGGPISWWVEQGAYRALPEPLCQDAPPAHPSLSLGAELDPTGGGLPVGETATARFFVTADAMASKSPDVVVGLEAPGGFLKLQRWEVLDDFQDCGEEYCPNDANDNPLNPPHDAPGESLEIHLNAMSPGETKMLALTLEGVMPTGDEGPARVQLWIKEVQGTYEKPTFDAEPNNIDDSQTFNGGDLKQELTLEVWADPGDGPGGGGGGGGGGEDGDPDGDMRGGCRMAPGATAGGAPWMISVMLGMLARISRRRRWCNRRR